MSYLFTIMDTYNKTRVEVSKPISSILLFPDFSQMSKHCLPVEYIIHIQQEPLQLSCTDISQIWKWLK